MKVNQSFNFAGFGINLHFAKNGLRTIEKRINQ